MDRQQQPLSAFHSPYRKFKLPSTGYASEFDNELSNEDYNQDYSDFVAYLSEWTKDELKHVRGNAIKERQALCRYYKRGLRAQLTVSELIDFLAVSTPNIIEESGYEDTEGDRLMQISDSLTEEEIDNIELLEDIEEPSESDQLQLGL